MKVLIIVKIYNEGISEWIKCLNVRMIDSINV